MQQKKSLFVLPVFAVLIWCSFAQGGYIDNGDGTVTDNGTGLMWQQATAPGTYTWEAALSYCENLILNNDGVWTSGTANSSGAKYSDWRLPTVKELGAIVDTTRYNPTINILYFPDAVASSYWSSTTVSDNASRAWSLEFYDGFVSNTPKNFLNYVRAVRLGQSGAFGNLTVWPVPDTGQTTCYNTIGAITCPQPGQAFYGQDANYSINTPAYTKLAAGCTPLPANATTWAMVRDDVTGLVWEEKHAMDDYENYTNPNDADNTYTWYDNNSATNDGNPGLPGDGTDTMDFIRDMNTSHYGEVSDWRMPTVKELQSLVDYGLASPSLNSTYFLNTVGSDYWSSTTHVYNSNDWAWAVSYYWGYVYYNLKTEDDFVRAVSTGECDPFSTSTTSTSLVTTTTSSVNVTTTVPATTTTTIVASTTTTTAPGKPCPTEAVLGKDNPQLERLRYFRDSRLAHSTLGLKMIRLYYTNADSINTALDRSPMLRRGAKMMLEVIAPMVGKKEE